MTALTLDSYITIPRGIAKRHSAITEPSVTVNDLLLEYGGSILHEIADHIVSEARDERGNFSLSLGEFLEGLRDAESLAEQLREAADLKPVDVNTQWNVINGTEIHCILPDGRAKIWKRYMGAESVGRAIDRGLGTQYTFDDTAREAMRSMPYSDHDARNLAMALYKHAVDVCTQAHNAMCEVAGSDKPVLLCDARARVRQWMSVLDQQPQRNLL